MVASPSPIDGARYPRLSRIQFPADLRRFDEDELPAIAEELRAYLIESVGRSGGHFGAGLGVIELTVALQTQFPHSSIKVYRYSESLVLTGFVDRPDHVGDGRDHVGGGGRRKG